MLLTLFPSLKFIWKSILARKKGFLFYGSHVNLDIKVINLQPGGQKKSSWNRKLSHTRQWLNDVDDQTFERRVCWKSRVKKPKHFRYSDPRIHIHFYRLTKWQNCTTSHLSKPWTLKSLLLMLLNHNEHKVNFILVTIHFIEWMYLMESNWIFSNHFIVNDIKVPVEIN